MNTIKLLEYTVISRPIDNWDSEAGILRVQGWDSSFVFYNTDPRNATEVVVGRVANKDIARFIGGNNAVITPEDMYFGDIDFARDVAAPRFFITGFSTLNPERLINRPVLYSRLERLMPNGLTLARDFVLICNYRPRFDGEDIIQASIIHTLENILAVTYTPATGDYQYAVRVEALDGKDLDDDMTADLAGLRDTTDFTKQRWLENDFGCVAACLNHKAPTDQLLTHEPTVSCIQRLHNTYDWLNLPPVLLKAVGAEPMTDVKAITWPSSPFPIAI